MAGATAGLVVLVALALSATPAAAAPASARLLSGTGIKSVAGRAVLVHVTLASRDDDDAAVAAALRSQGARPLTSTQAAEFTTIGFRWAGAEATQAYNPADEPVPGARAALQAAQQTWSTVEGRRSHSSTTG